jgi:hypothetical protein
MNMKKIIIYSLLTLVGFGFASCDFLDKLPDQRAEIDTQDKVRQLLTTAYTQGDYALLCELSSDQMIDNNAYRKLTEAASAKFFVKANGDTIVQERGILSDREIRKVREFIQLNYQEMYLKWSQYSKNGFYNG